MYSKISFIRQGRNSVVTAISATAPFLYELLPAGIPAGRGLPELASVANASQSSSVPQQTCRLAQPTVGEVQQSDVCPRKFCLHFDMCCSLGSALPDFNFSAVDAPSLQFHPIRCRGARIAGPATSVGDRWWEPRKMPSTAATPCTPTSLPGISGSATHPC